MFQNKATSNSFSLSLYVGEGNIEIYFNKKQDFRYQFRRIELKISEKFIERVQCEEESSVGRHIKKSILNRT